MSDQPKKSNFFEKLATFIVDKRNLIFFLYAIAIIASLITQSWVKVCDDLTQYLPETTETRRGLTLMEDEMKTYGTARIIVSHVTYEIARDLADQIEDLNNISSVDFWDADKSADDTTLPSAANKTYEDYMQGADALITVTFRGENDDQSAKDGLAAVKELLAPYDTYISTDVGYSKSETLNEEMGIILVVAALVIVLVLLLTSRSYAEVPVLLLTFVAAALLNKGGTGGVLGLAAAGTVTVRSCYNTGSVAGSTIVGGILGGERGEYSANAQYGCRGLTLENCYNAGGLLVGTATVRVGALAGYPIDGRYYTGLTVRKGACRFVMGWKCSQGDSVKESAVLTADTLFEGLVDSIGGVNSGYPLFDWQLLEQQSREEVVSYLNDRYEREIKPIATVAQCQEIEKLLTETAETIRTAKTTAEMTAAYEKVLARMSADDLLAAAKEAAQKQLDKLYGSAKKNYKDIAEQLNKLYETQKAAIEECANSVDTDAVLARFPAGVADLLIAARVKSGAAMRELAAALPEVRQVYDALTAAQKRLVVNGRAITDAQVLVTAYEQNLDLLRQWESADKAKYTAVKSGIGRLAADIRSQLGDCADASGMTAALNGYAAGVARLLLDKLAFTEGTTTLGQLHKASEVLTQTSEAVKGLTREQLALLPAEQVAGVSRAQLLLAVYTRASEQLDTWLKNDKASYADVAQRLERLADSVRQELERSVDRDSAAKALDHYCGGSVEVLISSIGTVKPVMPPTEAAAAKTRLQRARTAYNALTASQKALVPNYASLQEGETAYRTYESNYAAAKAAESLISAIGTVTADSGDAIRKAQEAYDALTAEQKQLVDARLVQQMETAAAQYRQLLAQSAENGGETPSADETMSDGVKPADRMQPTDQTRPEQAQPFDWSLVWLGGGILASAAAIALILRWLAAVRRTEKKNKA